MVFPLVRVLAYCKFFFMEGLEICDNDDLNDFFFGKLYRQLLLIKSNSSFVSKEL